MKVWFDLCEPKAPVYLKPLYDKIVGEHEVLITARDFDATYALLDEWGVKYYKVGSHGGKDLKSKLKSYIDRLGMLYKIVDKEKPEFLFSMAAPEAIRISYGLGMPNVMFYDEPRSVGCSKLTLPMTAHAIVSSYIPFEWYSVYGITKDRVAQFNGIDEVGWLNPDYFHPDDRYLSDLGLEPFKFIVVRPEATQSYSHEKNWLDSHQTMVDRFVPEVLDFIEGGNYDYRILLIPRYKDQYFHFLKVFGEKIKAKRIILRDNVKHLSDIMYYASCVASGGGTMVRESALLGVPSVEFIPSETYPQEMFLMENGFPLVHLKDPAKISEYIIRILEKSGGSIDEREKYRSRIAEFDNPIEIGYEIFKKYAE